MVTGMNDHEERWSLVGQAIREALIDSPERQSDLVKRLGISANKFRELRDGKPGNYRPETLAKVSAGLWREPSVLRRILSGEDPATMDLAGLLDALRRADELSPFADQVREVVRTAERHTDGTGSFHGVTPELVAGSAQLRDLIDELAEGARGRGREPSPEIVALRAMLDLFISTVAHAQADIEDHAMAADAVQSGEEPAPAGGESGVTFGGGMFSPDPEE